MIKPVITNNTEKKLDFSEVVSGTYKHEVFSNINALDIKCDNGLLIDITLIDSNMSKSSFSDMCFENCDFSNSNIQSSYFFRVTFKDCKLMGVDFSNSNFKNVSFVNCQMHYTNFSNIKCHNLEFINSFLKEASFNACELKMISFHNCDLSDSDFFDTSLNKIDLTTSLISGINVKVKDLKGAVVNSEEALYLSQYLGIIIEDR